VGFIGKPLQTLEIPEDPKDYFEVTPIDLGRNAIEGVRVLMHPDVLKYMADEEPDSQGEYTFFTILGGMKYTFTESGKHRVHQH